MTAGTCDRLGDKIHLCRLMYAGKKTYKYCLKSAGIDVLTVIPMYTYIWVTLLKIGQKCDIEGKNSKCEFFNAIIWK